jgi:hypothetical protein
LLEPNRRTTASTVDKSHPLIASLVFVYGIVYHTIFE